MAGGVRFRFPPRYADGPTARYITHMSAMRRRENGIQHRFTRVNHPWTNRQVERMNRTIEDATVKRFHYECHAQLERHLADFVAACNFGRRLKTLKGLTPLRVHLQAMNKRATTLQDKHAPANAGT